MTIVRTDLQLGVEAVAADHRNETPSAPVAPADELIIEPGRADRHYWRDLWRYRELFQVLAWRDISVRYKQTVIGALWAVVRPVLTVVVFTIVFGKLAQLPSEGAAPY